MLAEVLIFLPSVGRYWHDWLEERLAAGHIAVLSLAATPDAMISPELEAELLSHVDAYSVAVKTKNRGRLMLMATKPPMPVSGSIDLLTDRPLAMIMYALSGLVSGKSEIVRVFGPSPEDPESVVEIVINDGPLKRDLKAFAWRIFYLSLTISLITSALVYLALHLLIVRPMRRVTESMVTFTDDPEHTQPFRADLRRRDEIGVAERELAEMQRGLREALKQRARLAALGTGVSKISHDLRNILSTVRLISDSLTESDDPRVRRMTPTMVQAVDRAVDLCERTLTFARDGETELSLSTFPLVNLLDEVCGSLPAITEGQALRAVDVSDRLLIHADRGHLYRVIHNLTNNALQAGATQLTYTAGEERGDDGRDGGWWLTIADNGPGLPLRVREKLFQAFVGSSKADGAGLGLAIARELVDAHGGQLVLERSDAFGTTFRVAMPSLAPHMPQARAAE